MSVSAGRIAVNLDAGTSQFVSDLARANRAVGEFGARTVSSTQAASAAIRVVEGNIGNNIRAAEKFLTTIPGLGKALQAAFPLVGGIALLGVLGELVKKVIELGEAFKKIQQLPAQIQLGFESLNSKLAASSDQLRVVNDRLANDIAKLEGRPENTLALALDTARVNADKLAESLEKDLADVDALLKKQGISRAKGFFSGRANTAGVSEDFEKFQQDIGQRTAEGLLRIRQAPNQTDSDHARLALDLDLGARYYEQQQKINQQIQETVRLKEASVAASKAAADATPISGGSTSGAGARLGNLSAGVPAQYDSLINALRGELTSLQTMSQVVTDSSKEQAQQQKKDQLEASRNNTRSLRPQVDEAAAAIARLRSEIAGAKAEAAAAGNVFAEAIAKGSARTGDEITRLNQELQQRKLAAENEAKQNPALKGQADALPTRITVAQSLTIAALNTQLALNQAITTEKIKQLDKEKELANQAFGVQTKAILGISTGLPGDEDPLTKRQESLQRAIDVSISKINAETQALAYQAQAAGLGRLASRSAELAGISARSNAESKHNENTDEIAATLAAQLAEAKARFALDDAVSGRNDDFATGFQKFFQKFADNTQSAGNQVQTVLGGAFDGLNRQLTDLITGQKTSFSSFFRSIAAEIANLTLNNLFGSVAKQFLGGSSGGGSSSGIGGALSGILGKIGGGGSGGSGSPGGLFGGGGLGAIFSLLKPKPGVAGASAAGGAAAPVFDELGGLFGGFMADGGPLASNKWYIAGEHGPEAVWGGGSGAFASGYGKSGGNTVYNVDARGSDNSAETELRMRRGLQQAHAQGARDGAFVSQERRRRVPNSKAYAS